MTKRTTIFILVLITLLFAYLYSSKKMIIYNYSGQTIESVTVKTEFLNKEFHNFREKEVIRLSLFSPFDKKARIKVRHSGQVHTITFYLEGFFLGEKRNQLEIDASGKIKKRVSVTEH